MITSPIVPGERIGPYTIERRLGAGSMAEVFSATDADGRRVALKLPRRPAFLRHLRREGVLLAGVDHPHVARLIHADLDAEVPYLALELVEGQPLRALCRGTLGSREVTLLADQILAGLGAIHAKGIVHQDLKPENVIVKPDGSAVIVDLGLGRATSALMAEVYLSASLASREIPLAGTLAYMSPEQRKGRPVDGRADLFAFGVLLHELISGRLPDPATRLSKIRPDVTPRWDVVVARLTHPDPAVRVKSADEARRLVAFTLAEKQVVPVAEGGVEPRRLATYDEEALEWVSPWSAGMVVGEHELLEPLGRGGYGEVWRARKGDEERALKLAIREEARPALALEAAAAKRVSHPGVPRVLDDRTSDEPPHVVFELVAGTSLRYRLNEEGTVPLDEALETFAAMAEVVRACHRAGVIHRDLKPEHFLVDERKGKPRVTLVDFGLAALTGAPAAEGSLASGERARGTFDYMAPEQREGIDSGAAADVFALGVCLFELFADDPPRGPQRLKTLRPEVPDEIDALAIAMMARDPRERPPLEAALAIVRDAIAGRARGRRVRGITARIRASRLLRWLNPLREVPAPWTALALGALAAAAMLVVWLILRSKRLAP